ncbi:hypothetical protein [uncultured Jatrophihabitans sp.]|uniref:hypothetical protein n=1 Tax=uncultured Jatrophihabitans sp. TaxID=1610747 RepID=UPI0035C99195
MADQYPKQTSKHLLEHNVEQNTQPELSSPSPRPTTNSTSVRTDGSRNARDLAPDDDAWVVAYRVNRTNSTVQLASLAPPITEILRRKHWATLVRDEGWAFPLRYLAHVEKLLAGADTPVELFNLDGSPTPGQQDRERAEERTTSTAVLTQLRDARKASQTNPEAIDRARLDARQAFIDAIAAKHPHVTTDDTEAAS